MIDSVFGFMQIPFDLTADLLPPVRMQLNQIPPRKIYYPLGWVYLFGTGEWHYPLS